MTNMTRRGFLKGTGMAAGAMASLHLHLCLLRLLMLAAKAF